MNVPGIEAATCFQQIFEPPVGARYGGLSAVGITPDSQEATAGINRLSSSGVHGTTRGGVEGIPGGKMEK